MRARRHHWAGVVGLVGLLLAGVAGLGQEGKKRPIPPAKAQAEVSRLVDELYADELKKADGAPAALSRLAQTLLQEGRDTADNPAGRYVLFNRAHELAAKAGDVAIALQAAEELAQDFQIPPAEQFQMKVRTLSTAASAKASGPEAYQTVVDGALLLLEDTLGADDFKSSMALIDAADRAAIKLRNVALVSSIRKRKDEIGALQKEYARWEPFANLLVKTPGDPKANYEMGFYYALIKGNWDRGLPMLVRGAGPAAKAARLEKDANGAMARVAAAGAWYDFARAAKGPPHVQALIHASQLYLDSLPDLAGNERDKVTAVLRDITEALPPEYRVGEITGEVRKIDFSAGPVYDAAFSPDSRKLIATSYDGSLRLIDVRTGREMKRLEAGDKKVWSVAYAPDGRRVASGGFDNSVRLFDLTTGREARRFPGHSDYVRSVVISGDGSHILSGGDDRLLRLWSIETGKEVASLSGHTHFVWSVDISRDGKRGLSGSLDKTVRLWDLTSHKELKTLRGHTDTVLSVAFSPDGRRALSGSSDKSLKLWDLETGDVLQNFTGHSGYVNSVAFSPDGRRVLSGGSDKAVKLWDATTGKEIRTLEGHTDQVWSVAFSRDGRLALSTGQDRTVRIWGGAGQVALGGAK